MCADISDSMFTKICGSIFFIFNLLRRLSNLEFYPHLFIDRNVILNTDNETANNNF